MFDQVDEFIYVKPWSLMFQLNYFDTRYPVQH